jgi:hypothetical protein
MDLLMPQMLRVKQMLPTLKANSLPRRLKAKRMPLK